MSEYHHHHHHLRTPQQCQQQGPNTKLSLATSPKSTARFEAGGEGNIFFLFLNQQLENFLSGADRCGEASASGVCGSERAEVKVCRPVRCHCRGARQVRFISRGSFDLVSGSPRSTRCLPSRRRGRGWPLKENSPR